MAAAAVLIALLAIAAVFFAAAGRRYRRLYAPAHLAEISQRLAALAPVVAAAPLPASGAPAPAEIPHFTTSAGLALVWTRTSEGAEVHHLSISHASGPLPGSAALALLGYVVNLLGVDPRAVAVERGLAVTHAQLRLAATPAPSAVDPETARARFAEALARRQDLAAPPPP